MTPDPLARGSYYLVEQTGRVKRIQGTTSRTILDLTRVVDTTGNETGLLGLALHPRYSENQRVFLNYTLGPSSRRSRVSEVKRLADGTLDRTSERVILEVSQPYSNHNGGHLLFGPDGYLYIGFGDGGSAGDPGNRSQNLRTLLGKMLRIDVDHAQPYAIPPDNPRFDDAQAKPEIWAYGLRNPWRYSFDRVTGELWVGDVGQDAVEEIDVVTKGGNYGWNVMEGNRCYQDDNCSRDGLVAPVHEYSHSDGVSITGGYVYRGRAIPWLIGAYLYIDYSSGKLWALRRLDGGRVDNKLLLSTGMGVSSFMEDDDGELTLLDHGSGGIYKLLGAGVRPSLDFPRKLSDTGCFVSLPAMAPAAGVVPYDVSSALWSDGAAKQRWIKLPAGRSIRFVADRPFEFPEGTVLLKHFSMAVRDGAATVVKPLETRVLVKRTTGFAGYTYAWNAAGTEADLLGGALYKDLVTPDDVHFAYYYPSGSDCMRCHVTAGGGVLGFEPASLNRDVTTSGTSVNQLTQLARAGVFTAGTVPTQPDRLAHLPDPYDSASGTVEQRARSYLHTQCAHCHNLVTGSAQGDIDLRYHLTLAQTRICDKVPTAGDMGVPGARDLKPGDPDRSLIWLRTHTLDRAKRMPPLATGRRDDDGLELLATWIRGLSGCN